MEVLVLLGPRLHVSRGRAVQPDRPDEPVVLEGALAEDLGQATGRSAQRKLDLEEPFPAGHDPLREPQVVEGLGIDPGHAERVTPDRDRPLEAGEPEGALVGEERWASHLAELVRHAGEGIAGYDRPADDRATPR